MRTVYCGIIVCLLCACVESNATIDASATKSSGPSGSSGSGDGETLALQTCAFTYSTVWAVAYPSDAKGISEWCPDGEYEVVGQVVTETELDWGKKWEISNCPCGQSCDDFTLSTLEVKVTGLPKVQLPVLPECVKVQTKTQCFACVDAGGECRFGDLVVSDEADSRPLIMATSRHDTGTPKPTKDLFSVTSEELEGCSLPECGDVVPFSLTFDGFDQEITLESGEEKSGELVQLEGAGLYVVRNVRSYQDMLPCDDEGVWESLRVDWVITAHDPAAVVPE